MTKNLFIKNVRFGRFLSFYASCACGQVSQAVFCGKGSGMVANRAYKFIMYPNDERENNISFPKCRKVKTIAINRGLRLPINEKTFCISSQDR